MQTQRQKAPKINYRGLRLDLLRANLESFLALVTKPSGYRVRKWRSLSQDYHDLTDGEALRIGDVYKGHFWSEETLETEEEKRRRWLEFFVSLEEAEEALGTESEFYERFLSVSPFKGLVLFRERYRIRRHGKTLQAKRLWWRILEKHPHLTEAQIVFTQETFSLDLFIAFTQEAVAAQSAA